MSDDATKKKLFEALARHAKQPTSRAETPFAASLVRLYAQGKKRPFFCVHPGSGTVGCFTEVAPLVDPARPFFALQAPGVDGERDPFEDLCQLARGYVEEVRRAQPRGPYLLGGWSLGGTIAFQMAHELRRLGEEVAAVVLFDTQRVEALFAAPIPRAEMIEISFRQAGLATTYLASQRGIELDVAAITARFLRERPRSTPSRLALMMDILVEHGVFPDQSAPMFRVFRANLLALGDYAMPAEPYDRKLTLFRCANDVLGPSFAQLAPTYCWSEVTSQPVEVVPLPSHHFAVFRGEVLHETADKLRRCLDAADGGS